MNTIAKHLSAVTVASTVLLTGIGIESSLESNEAHAATTPYYTYKGDISKNPSVLLNDQFVKAAKYNNVTINGQKYNTKYTHQFSVEGGDMPTEFKFNEKSNHYGLNDFVKKYGKYSSKTRFADYELGYVSPNERAIYGPASKYYHENHEKSDRTYAFTFYKGKNILDYSKADQKKYEDKTYSVLVTFHHGSVVNYRFV